MLGAKADQVGDKSRLYLFYTMSAIGAVILAGFGTRAALAHETPVAIAEYTFLILTVANILVYFVLGNFIGACRILCLLLSVLLIAVGHFESGMQNGIFLWFFTFPFLTIFLTGALEGVIWSIALLVAAAVFMAYRFGQDQGAIYGGLFIARFIAVYFVATFMTYSFEKIRNKAQTNLTVSEDALGRKNEELRMLLSSISEVVFTLDVSGKLIRIFKPFQRSAFVDVPNEFIGQYYENVLPRQLSEGLGPALHRLETSGAIEEFPYEIGEGEEKAWFLAKVSTMKNAAGTPYGFTVVARNITLQKREEIKRAALEEGLARSEQQALMGRITAGVAHEINNPASAVTSDISTLLHIAGQLPDSSHKTTIIDILHRDRAAIARVTGIVSAVKGAFRPQQWHTIDINDEIELQLTLLTKECKDRIEIKREYGPTVSIAAYGSEIGQILLNLFTNAIDAIDEAGLITVRTAQTSDTALITVSDSGRGISAAHVSHIFEPFFTTKKVGKGTGLGLSISCTYATRHGGRLYVDKTTEGEGTTMVLEIPKKRIDHETV